MLKRKNSRICAIHFSEKMMFVENHNRTNLRADAVPDLYLPISPNSIEELPEEIVEQLQGNILLSTTNI